MLPPPFASKALRTTDSPISYFMKLAVENPSLISLAAGLVDEASLPAADVAQALSELLADSRSARAALQYGTTNGYAPLREQLLRRLCAADGTQPTAQGLSSDHVVVTTGSQQVLELVAEVLLDPGDLVLAEAPAYFVFQSVLQSHGARVLPVPMDSNGLDVEAVEAILHRLEHTGELSRLKLIYTCDYFQNPTGLTLSGERRRRLLELARDYSRDRRLLILEDAAYRELRYEGNDLPSIKSHDVTNEFVIYAGTFSKPCAPGLKTGYAILPGDVAEVLVRLKGNHDFGSNNLMQHVLSKLLQSGAFDQHVQTLRQVYRTKRDALLSALTDHFADEEGVHWTVPGGGLYVWMSLPEDVPTGPQSRMLEAALREGVLYIPGQFGHVAGEDGPLPTHEMRLSFGVAEPESIREGVRRLRRAYRTARLDDRAGSRRQPIATSTVR